MIMGDVKSSSINEIWHNSNYQELEISMKEVSGTTIQYVANAIKPY